MIYDLHIKLFKYQDVFLLLSFIFRNEPTENCFDQLRDFLAKNGLLLPAPCILTETQTLESTQSTSYKRNLQDM